MTSHHRSGSPRLDAQRRVDQLEAILARAERLGIPAHRVLLALGLRLDGPAPAPSDGRSRAGGPAADRHT